MGVSYKCTVPGCGKEYKRKGNIKRHTYKEHSPIIYPTNVEIIRHRQK